jgi:hypothetical protein
MDEDYLTVEERARLRATCHEHSILHCRECFPRPMLEFDRRCTAKHPTSGRSCQKKAGHEAKGDPLHERESSETGKVQWQ